MKDESNVIREISPHDSMFRGNLSHYFMVGESGVASIQNVMKIANKNVKDVKKILDFPSGYGRVLRHLKANFPYSQITACDIDQDAVDFCKKTFGAKPVYSKNEVDKIPFKDKFDLIWCGSLFTHIDKPQWEFFLNFFSRILNIKGLLLFTVHGRDSVHRMYTKQNRYGLTESQLKDLLRNYENDGFGFVNYSNQENYGISLSSPSFVLSYFEKISNLRILLYTEKGWANHHDVIACIKESDDFFSSKDN